MLRREFIKATGTVLAVSALPGTTVFAAEKRTPGRTVLPINRKWRYHPSKVEGAHLLAFNDATFESVVIPHTNVTKSTSSSRRIVAASARLRLRGASVCSLTSKGS
jgi:beta-galactosidase